MSTYSRSMETPHTELAKTAVSFIEDHLQDEIVVADIAAATSYSLYHFCRVFNQIVHHPPYDYLIRRRLSAAAQALIDGKQRITDIAFAYQFGSPESFSRAFRRLFGQLPTKWRKQGIRDPRVLMNSLTTHHLSQRNHPAFHWPTLVEKEAFTVVGLMTMVQDGDSSGQAISQLKQQLGAVTHTIYHYPDYWAEQGKPIFVGVLEEKAELPFVSQTITAHEYACFSLPELDGERPFQQAQYRSFLTDYIYQTWLPQSGYQLAAPLEVEQDQQLFVPIEMAE